MLALLIAAIVIAIIGWLAFACADDQAHALRVERDDALVARAATDRDNARLRLLLHQASTRRPTAGAEVIPFDRALAAVRALPTDPAPTLVLNEADETVRFEVGR